MTGSETRDPLEEALQNAIEQIIATGSTEDDPLVVSLKARLEEISDEYSRPDAVDFLNQSEVKGMLGRQRELVLEDAKRRPEKYQGPDGKVDPMKIEQEVNLQQMSMREEMMYDLPDEYLSEGELREREDRRAEIPGEE